MRHTLTLRRRMCTGLCFWFRFGWIIPYIRTNEYGLPSLDTNPTYHFPFDNDVIYVLIFVVDEACLDTILTSVKDAKAL